MTPLSMQAQQCLLVLKQVACMVTVRLTPMLYQALILMVAPTEAMEDNG
jgi:hypothetical protein